VVGCVGIWIDLAAAAAVVNWCCWWYRRPDPAARVLARGPSAADRTFDYLISSPLPPVTRRLLRHPSLIQAHAQTHHRIEREKLKEKKKGKKEREKVFFSVISLSRLRAYRACCFVIVAGQN